MAPRRERMAYRIREIRHVRGLTQARLAESVGCTESFIGQIERQIASPSSVLLIKIAHALGVTVDDLLPLNEPSPSAETAAVRS
jgi:transcriptional regulator with XRE-family HTH domain